MELIFHIIKTLKLPICVYSTASVLYGILKTKFNLDKEKIVIISLLIACKIEDIHGFLDKILENAIKVIKKQDEEKVEDILKYENEALEYLNFDFNFANIYKNAFAMALLGNEHGVKVSSWDECMARIKRCLSNEDVLEMIGNVYKTNKEDLKRFCNEISLYSLNSGEALLEKDEIKKLNLDLNNIKKIMKD